MLHITFNSNKSTFNNYNALPNDNFEHPNLPQRYSNPGYQEINLDRRYQNFQANPSYNNLDDEFSTVGSDNIIKNEMPIQKYNEVLFNQLLGLGFGFTEYECKRAASMYNSVDTATEYIFNKRENQ